MVLVLKGVNLSCSSISQKSCEVKFHEATIDKLIWAVITHFNEIHDPSFVARCKDDMVVEYNRLISKIKEKLSKVDNAEN